MTQLSAENEGEQAMSLDADVRSSGVLSDPDIIKWIDSYRGKYGLSRARVLRMAMVKFMEHEGALTLEPTSEELRIREGLALYKQMIARSPHFQVSPGFLQRNRIARSYNDAVNIIRTLVERGDIPIDNTIGVFEDDLSLNPKGEGA